MQKKNSAMPKLTPKFEKGDKVAYSVQFLKSIGMTLGEMPFARGTITGFSDLGPIVLAHIDWTQGSGAEMANVCNLAKVGPNDRFCKCD